MAVGYNMYGNPESSLFTSAGQTAVAAGAASALGWASVGLGVAGLGLSLISGAMGASASRKSARAQLSALRQESAWNLNTMRKNRINTFYNQQLESWNSGIDPTTGSTAAIILNNQNTLQEEINFQEQQYAIQMKNLKAQSKQKFLGLF